MLAFENDRGNVGVCCVLALSLVYGSRSEERIGYKTSRWRERMVSEEKGRRGIARLT